MIMRQSFRKQERIVMEKRVKITIDGKSLKVPEGMSVLECALQAGIYIPHLCHHPDLPENGSCRLCVAEVEGYEEVKTTCTLMAREGMIVHTGTDRVVKLRNLAMELLLAGHPEDCSTCPKYGDCELQTLIQYIGVSAGRMHTRVRRLKANEENPLLIHDMNRCVLCGRCIRACSDLRSVGILQYNRNETETYVGTLNDRLLKDADCRFCTACAAVCPTGSICDRIQAMNTDRTREELIVPCRAECPAHTDIPRYIRFVKEGDCDAAAAVIREKVPFPETLGLICTQVCREQCKRGEVSEGMSIRDIKRYAAEHDTGKYWRGRGRQLSDTGRKVCVVGGGPAGLTAAYYLRKQGHSVTVKEAMSSMGGMLSYGIPAYRLPREVIAKEVKVIEDQGVVMETGVRVCKPAELLKEYDAVLMAIGNHKGVRLPIEGNDLPEVLENISFLRQAAIGMETGIGRRVIVFGGGDVAFDCARTAKRLGAEEVHVVFRKTREAMTADKEEIGLALEEGIILHPEQAFERITGTEEGHVSGVDLMNVKRISYDENNRAEVEKEEGSEHHIDADTVIFATGLRTDISEDAGLKLGRANSIVVDENLKTSVDGIFAAGDAVYGTKTVVQAIASGREAAVVIDKYLGGDGDISETLAPAQFKDPAIGIKEGFGYLRAAAKAILPASERMDNFRQYDPGICEGKICSEAGRCLQCDLRLLISPARLWTQFSEGKEAGQA